MSNHTKVAIIGSGPAGWTAALYAARANLEPVIFTGMQIGGQLTITTDVENYPGFPDGIMGPELMDRMHKQAERFGTKVIMEDVMSVDFHQKPFVLNGDSTNYTADTVILSTGAQAMWLGLESEDKFKGYGISACATCDAIFFKDKTVAVVGGGNTAVTEALHLTHYAKEVYLIHRRDSLKAEPILSQRLKENKKIKFLWNSVLDEVLGEIEPKKKVTGARIKSTIDNSTQDVQLDGIFIAIGHKPNSSLFKDFLDIDEHGYVITDGVKTKIPGIFAAGDLQDKIYRQAATAVGTGCMAALEAQWFCDNL